MIPRRPRSLTTLAVSFCCTLASVLAAPTAVNDSYSVLEDNVLSGAGAVLLSADFESTPLPLATQWALLNTLPVGAGYPQDATGKAWNNPAFNPANLPAGAPAWTTTTVPAAGPSVSDINYYASNPSGAVATLTGNFAVNTYLFRNTFTATADQAATAEWVMRYLFDDGAIIYLNGQEVTRINMPTGAVTPDTLTPNSGNENSYTTATVDLTGKLQAGTNVLAVELHQTSGSSLNDAAMDISFTPSSGFTYVPDAFNTGTNGFNSGTLAATGGYNNTAGLQIDVGGRTPGNAPLLNLSGGYQKTFAVASAGTYTLSFRYRGTVSPNYDNGEFQELICRVDTTRYGSVAASGSLAGSGISLYRFTGNGNGNNGDVTDTDWQQASFPIALTAGTHTLTLGLFNNTSSGGTFNGPETSTAYFDDVQFGSGSGGSQSGVLTNDTGTGTLTATKVTDPTHGTLVFNSAGSFTYTPALNYNGPDSFTYTATDSTGTSAPATVSITVVPVNDPPVAGSAESYSLAEDTVLSVGAPGLLANDSDVDSTTLTAVLARDPANGTLTLNANGSFTYTPTANFNGVDNFQYRVSDGTATSSVVTVNLTITPVNDAPIPVDDTYSTPENTALVISSPTGTTGPVTLIAADAVWNYLDNGTDQGTAWTATAFNDTTWKSGPAELGYGDGDEATVVEDNATPGYNSGDSDRYITTYFRKSFTVADPTALSGVALRVKRDDGIVVYLNGTEIGRDLIAAGQNYQTLASNAQDDGSTFITLTLPSTLPFVAGNNVIAAEIHQNTSSSSDISFALELTATLTNNAGVLHNDSDPEGDAMTAILVSQPTKGTLSFNANGTFTYTPNQGVRGTDTFTYRATDGTLQSAPATVTITIVAGPNAAPIANADAYSTVEDLPLSVSAVLGVLANDTDPENDPLTAVLVAAPVKGTLVLNANGSFVYTPNANANGIDTFTYRAKDDLNNQSGIATVTVNIAPQNDAPVAANDTFGADPNTTLNVTAAQGVLANDLDVDGDTLTAQLVTNVTSGSLTLNPNGSFTYTPANGFTGNVTFTYRASDGITTSNTATATISVNGRPLAAGESYTTAEDTILSVSAANGVLKNDSDPENTPLTAQLVTGPTRGSVVLNADGSFSYTPQNNYFGTDSFTYAAFDGGRQSLPATVTLTITPVNDAPVAANDSYKTQPSTPLVVTAAEGVLKNDSDAEGSPLTASLLTQPASGTLSFAADGSFTYTPATDFTGTDSFTYRVSDGTLNSAPGTVTLTVTQTVSDIVISEIMYRPGTTFPELQNQEWLEIHNKGTSTIDLTGWSFTSGVSYAFPAGRTLAPGAYLVVAANVAAFQSTHAGVTNVVGGWVGALSNNAEKITLRDASGTEADAVTYATEGDWATRIRETTFNGWAWATAANGSDSSVELRNPAVSNDNGQNWAASTVPGGTPGAANSVATTNIPPIIKGVKHFPAVPKPTDRVVISCGLNDESPDTALTATLFWRDATTTSPAAFTSVAMSYDGRGTWFAPLDAKANGTIVEFYISASDGTNTRTWPAPTATGQNANCQYIVQSEVPSTTSDMYHLVMTAAENAAYAAVSSSSDRQFNQTLIVVRGQETSIRYRCDLRVRGNSSRTYQFRPMRISIPTDDDLDGSTGFNLNPRSAHLQYLGMRLFQAAGLRASDTIPIEIRRNGVEYTTSSGSTPDYGKWVRMEDVGRELVSNHWPLAGSGNAYKKGRNDFYWRATQTAPNNPDTLLDGFSKQNNSSLNDWSDLTNFFSVWMAASAPHFPSANPLDVTASGGASVQGVGAWDGTAFTTPEIASLDTVADLDQFARWLAVMTLLQDNETNLSNGEDDDYACYFEPRTVGATLQRRMQLVPHDLDTIFGLGDAPLNYNSRGLYDCTAESYVFRPLLPLLGNSLSTGNAAFRTKYLNALKELIGGLFNADTTSNPNPPFNQFVDFHLGDWVPATVRTTIKDFVRQRNAHLLGLIGDPATTPTVGTSTATLTSAHGSLFISEVLAQNVAAHSNGGVFPDVIELRNTGATPVDLSGKSLTDDALVKDKYVFPAGTSIPAGGYLIVYADSALTAGLHTGFGLNDGGDSLFLYDTVAAGQTLVDSVTFGLQIADYSIGRTGAALDVWALCTPTIGAPNTAVASLAPAGGLRINEVLGNADFLASDDFVELYNPAAQPVALGNMALTDDAINYPTRGKFPVLSFMGPTSFVAFEAKGSKASPGNSRELPYGLDSTVGNITLLGANSATVDRFDVVSHFRDGALGRLPDGTGTFARMAAPTPGFSNGGLPDNALAALSALRITEMMYNPASSAQSEYIELRNISDLVGTPVALDLSGISFTNGITYTFPAGTSLAPGAYFVLAGEPAKFSAQFPTVTVGGTFTGKLDNGGERIRMNVAGYSVSIHDFTYSDAWYPSTDGGGDALQIVSPVGALGLWDKQVGWQPAPPSPGAAPGFSVNAGPDFATTVVTPALLDGAVFPGTYIESSLALAWTKESGPGTVTFTTGNYQRANASFSAPGIYVLKLAATSPTPVTTVSDTVTVTVRESYDAWAARTMSGYTAAQKLATADPDNDGYSNLAEYGLGLDPKVPSPALQATVANNRLTLNYTRNPLADPSLLITPEISSELTSWLSGPSVVNDTQTGNGTPQTWQAQDVEPITAGQHRFLRLHFSLVP